jgi:acetyltransferase-like isoleucine patch superfamily enzyme
VILKKIVYPLIESCIRNISGGMGQKIRYQYYKRRFKSCGVNVKIDEGVIFQNPENMEIGSNVWFMSYSIITARPIGFKLNNRIEKKIINPKFIQFQTNSLIIGSEIQIGVYNIINGLGGLIISDRVTLSARVSIYSHSHYYRDDNDKTKVTYSNSMVVNAPISCIESPIVLEKGVWLGLGVIVLGGTIGKNSFITSNSVLKSNVEENSYISGNPGKKIKKRFDD